MIAQNYFANTFLCFPKKVWFAEQQISTREKNERLNIW